MEQLRREIEGAISRVYGIDFEVELTAAPEGVAADYATNVAMKLAKLVHKSPMVIAEELIASGLKAEIAAPGFMNFILPDEYFSGKVAGLANNWADFEKNISRGEYSGKTVVAEFSDPNPFKVLHVGHFYTSVVGDAISRLLETAGAKVVRANFGGDVGLHVAKTLYALSGGAADGSFVVDDVSELTIEDIAKAYVEGTRLYEGDEGAKQKITELNKEIYRINTEDVHEGKLAELYWRGRELSYEYFKDFHRQIGVEFDKFYPESSVAGRGLREVQGHIGRVYEESEGAIVYKGEKLGLHTRVFINREGVPTYETKDVGLLFTKWDDWHFDESVVVTGNEQTDYMKVVLASVSEYAPELTEKTTHLTHGLVKLPGNVKMSSRKGNFLKAVDVLKMIEDELGEGAERKVVLAAIKYAFLKYKMGGDIIFDPKESVSTVGNSGVYLLYSAVRAKKILLNCRSAARVITLENEHERKLSKKIVQYEEVLREAIAEKAPNKICTYLYELAQEFSRFYENVKVAGSEREAELAVLVKAYLSVMEHGLGLMGIEVPEEM